jgi:hypothetical protein
MVSSRTYGIAQSNRWIGRTLLSTYILGAAVRFLRPSAMLPVLMLKQVQWFSSLFDRIRESGGLCTDASTILTTYYSAVMTDVSAVVSVLARGD